LHNAFVKANVLVMTNASQAVEVFGDPVRRRLVESLAAQPQSVTDLAADLPVSRSAVSQHLSVLAGAGLVGYEVRGRRHLYHVKPDALAGLRAYLDGLWDTALATYAALADDASAAAQPEESSQ
jgi:DNA-binding transcriptional ArsR family regulator